MLPTCRGGVQGSFGFARLPGGCQKCVMPPGWYQEPQQLSGQLKLLSVQSRLCKTQCSFTRVKSSHNT